jgi:heterodisulfide reductase subunit C
VERKCPTCGTALCKVTPADGGAVSELMMRTGVQTLVRVVRPATYWSCVTCEHCEEVGRATA